MLQATRTGWLFVGHINTSESVVGPVFLRFNRRTSRPFSVQNTAQASNRSFGGPAFIVEVNASTMLVGVREGTGHGGFI